MKMALGKLPSKGEALDCLLSRWDPKPGTEELPLTQAVGRVLAEDLTARYDIPVVRASAMDGVAISFALTEQAGWDPARWEKGREYVRADTGDDFPDEYDTVVPIEQVTFLPQGGLSFSPELTLSRGMNVRPAGSQLARGAVVGRKGTVLTAMDLAAVGMGGYDRVPVVVRPRVAFAPTGSELVPIGSALQRGQNFDTNGLMAAQLLREMGAEPVLHPIVKDREEDLERVLDELLSTADIVLLNAGTSKGGEDYCAAVLQRRGALLHGVAAVPGRPMSVAVIGGKPVLNLSGPALAAFYGLDWAVRPLVCRWLGVPVPVRERITATLTAALNPPPAMSMMCRLQVVRTPEGKYLATPLAAKGPGSCAARTLCSEGVYISTPGEPPKQAGETLQVELLRNRAQIREAEQ